mmetsp:Transcript_116747/g.371515  ORF Transcript_116747/g.371515 Transcript_116747/m.371515 type:complete len:278 (-) Transcript_116747:97-930(-)
MLPEAAKISMAWATDETHGALAESASDARASTLLPQLQSARGPQGASSANSKTSATRRLASVSTRSPPQARELIRTDDQAEDGISFVPHSDLHEPDVLYVGHPSRFFHPPHRGLHTEFIEAVSRRHPQTAVAGRPTTTAVFEFDQLAGGREAPAPRLTCGPLAVSRDMSVSRKVGSSDAPRFDTLEFIEGIGQLGSTDDLHVRRPHFLPPAAAACPPSPPPQRPTSAMYRPSGLDARGWGHPSTAPASVGIARVKLAPLSFSRPPSGTMSFRLLDRP